MDRYKWFFLFMCLSVHRSGLHFQRSTPGLLMIRLTAFQASGGDRMKLRLAGTENANAEHRTSNIERRILMALRFIESEISESQPATGSAESILEG